MLRVQRLSVYLLAAILLMACNQPSKSEQSAEINSQSAIELVSVAQVAERLSHDATIVLDIRTAKEFEAGRIRGALNIDYFAEDFKQRIDALDKSSTYIVHCESGGRSGRSMEIFQALGFQNILHLKSGFSGWQQAGLPIEK